MALVALTEKFTVPLPSPSGNDADLPTISELIIKFDNAVLSSEFPPPSPLLPQDAKISKNTEKKDDNKKCLDTIKFVFISKKN
ncbi:hypothetical protein GCM10010992_11540 [Cloacibacterium rupense]|uniref:Uncharacterized protein n=1 Tax=Cloacibacterium rupense TaxID=517423 RepID=A0ABQ2NHC9_9FLAO|nr:hypothetical protein GCM10010992_11540 [Cloacibacterium rupense]